ncbi:hypothetical protein NLJ89_g2283 [Agrocybe chaxingu]|uniref:3'-5' exonuclease n=1 Tax=Agrocybe chaxingu TaxID=84603 RepID=A0A9W8K6X3_9AGAR|nr:hypothetical protein NLJ89_g2283 [Agrocybe chaxingu]
MSDSAQTVPPQSEPADSPTPWKPRIYTRDHHQANVELARLCLWDDILGFDLEWKPNFVKGGRENRTALVQLANRDTILLVQISAMQEFPVQLRLLLENPGIVKCGVAIQCDAKKIFNDFGLSVRSCVDLSLLARTVDNARWRGKYNSSLGLAHLVESYEYRMLLKGKITRTNWERVLDFEQQEYASNDAHAAYVLYRKLANMVPSMPSPPEPLWYSFNAVGGSFLTPEGKPWQAQNPNYDPGPPPPPREDKKDRKGKRKADDDVVPEQPDGVEPNRLPHWQPDAQQSQQATHPPGRPLLPFSVKERLSCQ